MRRSAGNPRPVRPPHQSSPRTDRGQPLAVAPFYFSDLTIEELAAHLKNWTDADEAAIDIKSGTCTLWFREGLRRVRVTFFPFAVCDEQGAEANIRGLSPMQRESTRVAAKKLWDGLCRELAARVEEGSLQICGRMRSPLTAPSPIHPSSWLYFQLEDWLYSIAICPSAAERIYDVRIGVPSGSSHSPTTTKSASGGKAAPVPYKDLVEWFRGRVTSWPDDQPFPAMDVDWDAADRHFGCHFARSILRAARVDGTPDEWRATGPRGPHVTFNSAKKDRPAE